MIVAFFLIVTAIFGAFEATSQSEQQAVLKNIINVENKDGMPFETMLSHEDIAYIDYGYQLEQCQLWQSQQEIEDTALYFLPVQHTHVRLLKGRFPQEAHEIVVSQSFDQKYHQQSIVLTYQQKSISLTVVGVLQKDFFSQNEIYLNHTLKQEMPELMNNRELIVESQFNKNESLYQALSKDYIVYSEIQERVSSYQSLLSLAQIVAMIFIGMSLLISLILIGIVESIIYFERKHDIAYLLSLGISSFRLFILSLFEAVLLGLMIAGGGCLLAMVIYEYINHVVNISQYVSFSLLLKPIFYSRYDLYVIIFMIYLVMSVLSVLHPVRKMMKMTKIDVLREE